MNGRDELPIPDNVKLDVAYLHRQSLWFDIWILWLTLVKMLRRDGSRIDLRVCIFDSM